MNPDIFQLIDDSLIFFQPNDKGNVIARATVDFGSLGITLRGFVIGKSGEKYWCQPPRFSPWSGMSPKLFTVWIEDAEAYKYLMKKIVDQYTDEFG